MIIILNSLIGTAVFHASLILGLVNGVFLDAEIL